MGRTVGSSAGLKSLHPDNFSNISFFILCSLFVLSVSYMIKEEIHGGDTFLRSFYYAHMGD